MSKLYWYFSRTDKRLRYDDRRLIMLGTRHRVEGKVILCNRGLHASLRAFDALNYAPGPIVWRVRLGGKIVEGGDKTVANERVYVAGGINASDVIEKFARDCALDVIKLWDCPPIVKEYLETGNARLYKAAANAANTAADSNYLISHTNAYATSYAIHAAIHAIHTSYASFDPNVAAFAAFAAIHAAAAYAINAINATGINTFDTYKAAAEGEQNARLEKALKALVAGAKA